MQPSWKFGTDEVKNHRELEKFIQRSSRMTECLDLQQAFPILFYYILVNISVSLNTFRDFQFVRKVTQRESSKTFVGNSLKLSSFSFLIANFVCRRASSSEIDNFASAFAFIFGSDASRSSCFEISLVLPIFSQMCHSLIQHDNKARREIEGWELSGFER